MEIAEIHIFKLDLPVKNGPYSMANAKVYSLDTTLVKIITKSGQIGWGETCPVGPTYAEAHAKGARAALQEMAPGLIGCSIEPKVIHAKMDSLLNGHNYAKAAIDIASHDALGKILGVSVSSLLGGALRKKVPSYYATGVGPTDEVLRVVREKILEGYPRIQIKVGGKPIESDIETIKKVWESIEGKDIRMAVDANRGWSTEEAIQVSRECSDVPFVMEQPCDTIEDLQQIKTQINHSLYMDENSTSLKVVRSVVDRGIVDGFGMKVTRIGGLEPMKIFRDICENSGLPHTCDDSWGGDIIAAACTHVASTVKENLLEGAWLAAPYIEGNYDRDNGIKIIKGYITVPEGSGLGVVIDETLFGSPIFSF